VTERVRAAEDPPVDADVRSLAYLPVLEDAIERGFVSEAAKVLKANAHVIGDGRLFPSACISRWQAIDRNWLFTGRPRSALERVTTQGEETARTRWGDDPFPLEVVARMRRSRRHPRPTQFDYLHLHRLVGDLAAALARIGDGSEEVLDVFCGTRPYDDLLPPSAHIIGFDIPGNPYGVADIVSSQFLPFPDESFDLVMCIEGFHYVADPQGGLAEIRRVLRHGGHALISVPLVWEYDRTGLEHRFTGPSLERLFDGWGEVTVVENGGRAVSWATLSGLIASMAECHVPERLRLRTVLHPAFAGLYLLVNSVGFVLDRAERRFARSSLTLPMNLLVTAVRPPHGVGS
jgi:SAM-dependent methyltransferase